jgi:hypothetical protein
MNVNNNNKVIAIVVGAVAGLFFLGFIVRFIILSQYGYTGPWIWFAIPFGGIGLVVLLLRLGLLANFFQNSNSSASVWNHNIGAQAPPAAPPAYPSAGPVTAPPTPPATAQRLQHLDTMRANGAISESEYNSQREQIISAL